MCQYKAEVMPRLLKGKILTNIPAAWEGSTYQLLVEDEAGKRALFMFTTRQALQFADLLDDLLADEEEELGLTVFPPKLSSAAQEGFGVVDPLSRSGPVVRRHGTARPRDCRPGSCRSDSGRRARHQTSH